MDVIKDLGKPKEGGYCAKCKESFNSKFMRRLVVEYWDDEISAPIAEPFNFCNSCTLQLQ